MHPDLESQVRSLARSVEALSHRVEALETPRRSAEPVAGPVAEAAVEAASPDAAAVLSTASRTIHYLGRLLIVLGGAYFLRSLTGGFEGRAAQIGGASLGLAYAGVWLGAAWRAGRREAPEAAAWHGVAAVLVAVPLIWETSARFGIFSPPVAAVLLGAFALTAVGIAWRYHVQPLAWMFVLFAALAGLALMVPNAGAAAPITLVLIVLGFATLWAGRTRGWTGLASVAALAADLAAATLIYHTLESGEPQPITTLALLILLLVVYVGSIAFYLLRGWWRLDALDVVQSVLALVVGIGGGLHVARATGPGASTFCGACLVLAAGAYVLAFKVIDRSHRNRFYYLTSVALVLVLLSGASLLPQPAWLWAPLAVVMGLLGMRYRRMTLGLHAVAYVFAAAVAAGLLAYGLDRWVGVPLPGWGVGLAPVGLLVLGAAALVAFLPVPGRTLSQTRFIGAARLVVFALLAWAGGGVLVTGLSSLLPTLETGGLDPAWLGAARTAVVALLALLAAASSARFLVAPLLVLGALKLVVEDLPHGRPATLAVSFGLYGLALILAPRIVRALKKKALPLAALLALATVVGACGGETSEHGVRFPSGAEVPLAGAMGDLTFEVPPPPFKEEDIFPCTECHDNEDLEVNRERRVLEAMHEDIVLEHDAAHRWCLDCHDAENRDMLRLASGTLVPFTESYRLCGQCHGSKFRDWRAGVHGRRIGSWNGEKQYLLCVHCHDSHSPRFKPLAPMPAPTRPEDLR